MAGSLLRTNPCQDRTPQNFSITEELPGWQERRLGHPLVSLLVAGSAEGRSPQNLHRTPALGNTWPGSDARDTGVGASSFGRGKSRGIQTSDYLGPELLSGGSL